MEDENKTNTFYVCLAGWSGEQYFKSTTSIYNRWSMWCHKNCKFFGFSVLKLFESLAISTLIVIERLLNDTQ